MKQNNFSVGSVCSGIEAASVAWKDFAQVKWFSEIADFPSKVLSLRYPTVPNLGDMKNLPTHIREGRVEPVQLLAAGTPCQAFSLAGWKRGLADQRGNLTSCFVDIADANDLALEVIGKEKTILLWENVEGVLKDKTNAFGCLVSSMAGLTEVLSVPRWPKAGFISGPKRNIAWRVLDSKYFGVPQQRKRVYLISGGKDFRPENVLFESLEDDLEMPNTKGSLSFSKGGSNFKFFRSYTDCLYSAYGTKWNGNAAAYNGSLFVLQNERLRRFSPMECERLMGFPDDYTNIPGSAPTSRYQALGNSWPVPVVQWLGRRFEMGFGSRSIFDYGGTDVAAAKSLGRGTFMISFSVSSEEFSLFENRRKRIHYKEFPEDFKIGDLSDIVDPGADERFYLSPAGCRGMLRRASERNACLNKDLKSALSRTASNLPDEEIERISRRQKRGRLSVGGDQSIPAGS